MALAIPRYRHFSPARVRSRLPGRTSLISLVVFLLWPTLAFPASGMVPEGSNGTGAQVLLPLARPASWNRDWAVADFDGDQRPDLASTEAKASRGQEGLYRVTLRLSAGATEAGFDIHWSGRAGLNISARDVDGDHDLDLVITAGIFRQPVGIWINDGKGTFTEADVSLYPKSLWREPPAVGSDNGPSKSLHTVLPKFRSGLAPPENFLFVLPCENSGLRRPHVLSLASFLRGGPFYVRPPPRFTSQS